MSPQAAARTMRIIGWISIPVALFFAWGSVSDMTGANNLFFQYAAAGDEGISGIATQQAKLALAIAGGLFGGLMGYYLFISAPGIAESNALIRRGTIYAFLTWFVIDSSASIGTGNAFNAVINVAILALYLTPVLLARNEPAAQPA
ncbi:MAG: hypothetical protein AAGM33_12100 [Pseudomonadota bacterium]